MPFNNVRWLEELFLCWCSWLLIIICIMPCSLHLSYKQGQSLPNQHGSSSKHSTALQCTRFRLPTCHKDTHIHTHTHLTKLSQIKWCRLDHKLLCASFTSIRKPLRSTWWFPMCSGLRLCEPWDIKAGRDCLHSIRDLCELSVIFFVKASFFKECCNQHRFSFVGILRIFVVRKYIIYIYIYTLFLKALVMSIWKMKKQLVFWPFDIYTVLNVRQKLTITNTKKPICLSRSGGPTLDVACWELGAFF